MSKRLSAVEAEMFLTNVGQVMFANPELMAQLFTRVQVAVLAKLEQVNDMRVEAEFTLMSVYGLVPAKKLQDNPVIEVRAKKVLMESGAFAGTQMAEQFERDITGGEQTISANREQAKLEDAEKERGRRQRLRNARERERQKKEPVATITPEGVAKSVASGESKLTPYKITGGKDEWNFHAWVLVVNEESPSKPQERSMLYVGEGNQGRFTYATIDEAHAAMAEIAEYSLKLQSEKTQ